MWTLEAEYLEAVAGTDQDTSRGALLITPVALSDIEDRICPICHDPYIEPHFTSQTPAADEEWPVSVDMVAEWFGPKRCCGHIMGRRCLEKHLKSAGEWSNKCPLCRDIWFHKYAPSSVPESEEPPAQEDPTHTVVPLRRSRRIAERQEQPQQDASESSMSARNRVGRIQHRKRRPRRPARFTAQLLAALEVEDGSDEIKGTLREVEGKLQTLYRKLQV